MDEGIENFPGDIATLRAALVAERRKVAVVQAELAQAEARAALAQADAAIAQAQVADAHAIIEDLKLRIAKARHERWGQSSERQKHLLDQLELQLGESITETREVVPRQWIVVQTVREKFLCQDCEKISQPPAPFHPIARASAGPNLLAMVLFNKFGLHQPLNRQSETYAAEGADLSVSTLADYVGHTTSLLAPVIDLLEAHIKTK